MKTVSRIIRRYISAAFGIVVAVLLVNAALLGGTVVYWGSRQNTYYPMSRYTDSFVRQADGRFDTEIPLSDTTFCWAMLLDADGSILWQENLPESLNHSYTVPEIASFTRWYLDDYPVMVYRNDFGLVVAGLPRGSITRFDFYMDNHLIDAFLSGAGPLLLLDAGIILFFCLLLGWKAAKPLRDIAQGIDRLAEGNAVCLKAAGSTGELAEKLNQASERLQAQAKMIERRDTARTNWIAGVSHDIRTPLSLIVGYAEQLEQDGHDAVIRQKAASIRIQSMKIKKLVEDLNLTSKLQYHAHPLRRETVNVGPWLRQCLAAFCDGLDENHSVEICISESADRAILKMDRELMTRALDNLLVNSARHNPDGCMITVRAEMDGNCFKLSVRDNGAGYPAAVLEVLRGAAETEHTPHILGLHLVQQIVDAHHGSVRFFNHEGGVSEIMLEAADSAPMRLPT